MSPRPERVALRRHTFAHLHQKLQEQIVDLKQQSPMMMDWKGQMMIQGLRMMTCW
jgi:hypothetical protein